MPMLFVQFQAGYFSWEDFLQSRQSGSVNIELLQIAVKENLNQTARELAKWFDTSHTLGL